jgi:hypothetical protein
MSSSSPKVDSQQEGTQGKSQGPQLSKKVPKENHKALKEQSLKSNDAKKIMPKR